MNNEWRSCGTTTARGMRVWIVPSLRSLFYLFFLFLSFSVLTLSHLSHFPVLRPLFASVRIRKCVCHSRARHTSWLLIHVAADYFSASLWHQIPYSSQNGESTSLRARWSTRTSNLHRILMSLFTRPLLSRKYLGGGFRARWFRYAFALAKIC